MYVWWMDESISICGWMKVTSRSPWARVHLWATPPSQLHGPFSIYRKTGQALTVICTSCHIKSKGRGSRGRGRRGRGAGAPAANSSVTGCSQVRPAGKTQVLDLATRRAPRHVWGGGGKDRKFKQHLRRWSGIPPSFTSLGRYIST